MKNILIADDDTYLLEVFKDALVKEGYSVKCASDGDMAVEIMKTMKPDLILLDVLMPKRDGFEVLRERNKIPELANVPVVMLTVLEHKTDREMARRLKATEYLIKKDMDVPMLMELVKKMLG